MLQLPKDQMVAYRDQAITALNAVMTSGESYEITHADGSKQRVSRANIKDIQTVINFWQEQIMNLAGKGGPVHVRPSF